MKLPMIEGVIRRRVLVNFRVDPAAIRRVLPPCFEPKLVGGSAIAGICLIRLEKVRPRGMPACIGLASENAAHRVAVQWRAGTQMREGVYIPRRDTDSCLNRIAGGRVFPGFHHPARFEVETDAERVAISMRSNDGTVQIDVRARHTERFPAGSCFRSLDEVSRFFELGSYGYSDTPDTGRLEGLELATNAWRVEPLAVESVRSSFFEDEAIFPRGSVALDCALFMRDIAHRWSTLPALAAR